MTSLVLKACDMIIQFLSTRERNHKEYFDRYVQPAYESAKIIYKDYRLLLLDLRKMVEHEQNAKAIVEFLVERREALSPTRDQLRAIIAERIKEGHNTKFEVGILGLMTGAITAVDRPRFYIQTYDEEIGKVRTAIGTHTVLDILQRCKDIGDGRLSSLHTGLLRAVDSKMRGIEIAWGNIVDGYAELQTHTLPALNIKQHQNLTRYDCINEMRKKLDELSSMVKNGRYTGKPGKDLVELAANALPDILPLAQVVREVSHNLVNREPHVTKDSLKEAVNAFEQALSKTQ